jgi:isoprenylcysteine carboxyl methyltransferase (ICMT) family protein YpbQ
MAACIGPHNRRPGLFFTIVTIGGSAVLMTIVGSLGEIWATRSVALPPLHTILAESF